MDEHIKKQVELNVEWERQRMAWNSLSENERMSLLRRAEESGTSFVDESLGIVIAKKRSLGKKNERDNDPGYMARNAKRYDTDVVERGRKKQRPAKAPALLRGAYTSVVSLDRATRDACRDARPPVASWRPSRSRALLLRKVGSRKKIPVVA